ncbi:flagellar hook-basal body complex protein [Legionella waltersii]|uniref:Flagellar hook protein FlgE n=1 Tax=Legionella waltersii TaxID=66969 RepID=A0A0W1AP09_9GAMM|nr:flagellar hook-basal body complex protein [Legionella waltersii]KTD82963.1 flagellar hook protein FlgE [Legionella waltersii]SNU97290.1 flagellar hook protein FlgE [Legionella waltersii]
MSTKSLLFALIFLVTAPLYAANVYQFSDKPLTVNRCSLIATDNPLDLALMNDGYFVVSKGKKDSELLFTRFGKFLLNRDGYIVSTTGDYLLGINKKSNPNQLSKLKISTSNLPPKATSRVNTALNLPATARENDSYLSNGLLYDSISGTHSLSLEYTKIGLNTWSVQVTVDEMKLNTGTLTFKNNGVLSEQEGLSSIQWPTAYGLNELKIDHTQSTSYASPFVIQHMSNNGYPVGLLTGLTISRDGGVNLLYTNGQYRELKNHIAVAKFLNPTYLEFVRDHFYRPTEKSGPQRLHRVNSDYAVLSGFLEQEPCLHS